MELVIDRLTKQFQNKIAVDRVSLRLHSGVFGLLGTNGAGKTTLMRMLCGILQPTSGTIAFDGMDVREEGYRAVLGYLPQDFGYYPEFTAMDFLLYMAALKGLPKQSATRRANELLELVGLQDMGRKKIKTFSGGMKQRLGIAQALLNNPKLLILDEPTAGLDPKERVRFRNLIQQLGKDSIVLLSTHIVSDIEHIADEVLMMKDGTLIYNGTWDEQMGDLESFYLAQFEEGSHCIFHPVSFIWNLFRKWRIHKHKLRAASDRSSIPQSTQWQAHRPILAGGDHCCLQGFADRNRLCFNGRIPDLRPSIQRNFSFDPNMDRYGQTSNRTVDSR